MSKLPVGKTIVAAYTFTFENLGAIIGLVWFPLVLLAVLSILPELSDRAGGAPTSARSAETVAVTLLSMLLYAVAYVAVTRQALGLRTGPATFHFSLGLPEFRVFGTMLLIWMIVATLALLMGVFATTAATLLKGGGDSLSDLLLLPMALVLLYVLTRLRFLAVPVTLVENRVDVMRLWLLSRGNVGRIILVCIAIAAPLLLVESAVIFALAGKDVVAALPAPGTNDPKVIEQHVNLLEAALERHLPQFLGVELIFAPFYLGLMLSAGAFAYRALATPDP